MIRNPNEYNDDAYEEAEKKLTEAFNSQGLADAVQALWNAGGGIGDLQGSLYRQVYRVMERVEEELAA